MLLKNVSNPIKTIVSILFLGLSVSSLAQAQPLRCDRADSKTDHSKFCVDTLKDLRQDLNEQLLTTYLVTDAPLRLIDDTHQLWLGQTQQCKSVECVKQQFNVRIEDLNIYTSMNQTLTQHYLKYEKGQIAKQAVHLKIHQLSKDRIKIEGLAYRNPKNRAEARTVPLLAYTTTQKKNEIIDNEHDCKYQLTFQKALLRVSSQQQGCERFVGMYRLYD